MKFLSLSLLMMFANSVYCQHQNKTKENTSLITREIPDPNVIDSLANLQCQCFDKALEIKDATKMKLFGLNSYSSMTSYFASLTYSNEDLKKKYEKKVFDLVGEAVYNTCPSFMTFASKLNQKRKISIHLKENPELVDIAKTGKFINLEVDEEIVTTLYSDRLHTDYKDLNYYSLSKIEWINEFTYLDIFQESNHPYFSWKSKGDTTIVRIIDIKNSIVDYDMISPGVVYPGLMKKIE